MSRHLLALGLVFLAAPVAPAGAQETLAARVEAAYGAFGQNLTPEAMAEGGYYDAIAQGIDGTWVLASALFPAEGSPIGPLAASIATACAGSIVTRMAVSEPLGISFTRGGPAAQFAVNYVYAGGATFDPQVDPAQLLGYLGILDNEEMADARINALNASTQPVTIFRPADDVLAVVQARGLIEIYARCPGEDPPPVDTSALEIALGAAFDQQYPKVKNQTVRATFISCVVAALAPLPPSDVQLLIDTNFDPPSEDLTRIGDTYPSVRDETLACGQAADAVLGRN